VPRCLPQTAGQYLGLPAVANLTGYVVGALLFGLLADRFGRRDLLVLTMVIAGLGSFYTAFVNDYANFIVARALTGVGVGADLVLVNTYISELAPTRARVKYSALIFILAACGATVSVWLGLYLTTPPVPFPSGLPFAVASEHFTSGWRVLYGIGALLTPGGLLLRMDLPESPRWLLSQGRLTEAENVVARMERRALTRVRELPSVVIGKAAYDKKSKTGYIEIFRDRQYIKRTVILLVIWLAGYITVYSLVAGQTVLLTGLGYSTPEAGMISATGTAGSVFCGLVVYFWGERFERSTWIMLAAGLSLLGGGVVMLSSFSLGLAFLGAFLLSTGSYHWLPATYTWTTENYPTRARASGFALANGIGHMGGIGVYVLVPATLHLGSLLAFLLISCFLMVAAGLAFFGPMIKGKRLEDVSP
jgi:MFS family permease